MSYGLLGRVIRMNENIVIAADGYMCGFCHTSTDAPSFRAASRFADEHLRETHDLRWVNVAAYRLQQVANGRPFLEFIRESIR